MYVCDVSSVFPLAKYAPGDVIFFHRLPQHKEGEFAKAVVSSSPLNSNIFHVALIVDSSHLLADDDSSSGISIVHATSPEGVIVQRLERVVNDLKPDLLELCSIKLDRGWKTAASEWAVKEVGGEYNDLFTPDCINSRKKRSFYCCQLVSEAYKASNNIEPGKSPFLPHTLNFADSEGRPISYWLDYYKTLSPWSPEPPQGKPGTHPSILRSSPCVDLTASRLIIDNFAQLPNICSKTGCSSFVYRSQEMKIPKDLLESLHFVNGARVNLKSATKFKVFEPRNGELLTECHDASASEVNEAISAAHKAQQEWALTPWVERRRILQRAADLIRKTFHDIAEWEVRDNGKSVTEAKADVLSCADTFEYYSGVDLAGEHFPYADRQQRFAYTRREPLGVVGAIGAWNFPIQTATWKIAPAIACGNSIVYKPSPLAPVSSVILAHLLQCAGVPDGVVNIVQGGAETGSALCTSSLVRKISFTGSIQTGKAIAAAAATASLKPVTLELGGKSACVVFADCDVQMAVNGALMANFFTQGEVCTNASKILVHRSIVDEFTKKLLLRTAELKIGDPMNESTHIGAYISAEHMSKVQNFIDGAVKEGAKLLYGGEKVVVEAMEGGYYLSPCVLTEITPEMTIYREEVFGAVLLVIPFDTEEEALKIANDTETGLAAGIFTNNLKRAHTFASQLEAGTVYINTYNDVSQYVPFGGYKQSGYGRENGKAAVEFYTQIKSVFVNASGKLENPFA